MVLEVKLARSDLPRKDLQPIQDALCQLWNTTKDQKHKTDAAHWAAFARVFRASLDQSLGGGWHVVVGNHFSYALKKRNETMGEWKVGEKCRVIIYQSPATEPPLPPRETQEDEVVDARGAATLKVLSPPKVEAGSQLERVVDNIRESVRHCEISDAAALRVRLTEGFGPVWHVVTGNEFAFEPAQGNRNFVSCSSGKAKVVCCQHEQEPQMTVNWRRFWATTPWIILFILLMGTFKLCRGPPPESWPRSQVYERFCESPWEDNVKWICITAVIVFLSRRALSKAVPAFAS